MQIILDVSPEDLRYLLVLIDHDRRVLSDGLSDNSRALVLSRIHRIRRQLVEYAPTASSDPSGMTVESIPDAIPPGSSPAVFSAGDEVVVSRPGPGAGVIGRVRTVNYVAGEKDPTYDVGIHGAVIPCLAAADLRPAPFL